MYKILIIEDDRSIADAIRTQLSVWDMDARCARYFYNMLLLMFSMTNTLLSAQTCLISFTVFGLFYVIVYRITSNAYYSIVSGARED